MVMGGDSCTEGHGLESLHHIVDGYFLKYFCNVYNCNLCLKRRN